MLVTYSATVVVQTTRKGSRALYTNHVKRAVAVSGPHDVATVASVDEVQLHADIRGALAAGGVLETVHATVQMEGKDVTAYDIAIEKDSLANLTVDERVALLGRIVVADVNKQLAIARPQVSVDVAPLPEAEPAAERCTLEIEEQVEVPPQRAVPMLAPAYSIRTRPYIDRYLRVHEAMKQQREALSTAAAVDSHVTAMLAFSCFGANIVPIAQSPAPAPAPAPLVAKRPAEQISAGAFEALPTDARARRQRPTDEVERLKVATYVGDLPSQGPILMLYDVPMGVDDTVADAAMVVMHEADRLPVDVSNFRSTFNLELTPSRESANTTVHAADPMPRYPTDKSLAAGLERAIRAARNIVLSAARTAGRTVRLELIIAVRFGDDETAIFVRNMLHRELVGTPMENVRLTSVKFITQRTNPPVSNLTMGDWGVGTHKVYLEVEPFGAGAAAA